MKRKIKFPIHSILRASLAFAKTTRENELDPNEKESKWGFNLKRQRGSGQYAKFIEQILILSHFFTVSYKITFQLLPACVLLFQVGKMIRSLSDDNSSPRRVFHFFHSHQS
eukprot:snap_masked-scaffold19_size710362-processed-gene-6.8 protein:Tk00418 transcript:snap_masked-scaffold19_size710362-processed-gene-6.8-mRNA-1 annotation:"hypothetical protein F442_01507"